MKKMRIILASLIAIISILTIGSNGVNAEWRQSKNSWWYSEGNSYAIGWKQIDSVWYYFDDEGYMKNGWLYDNEKWYYLGLDGAMQTGIIQVDGKTYYLESDGAMKIGNIIIGKKTVEINLKGNPTTGYNWEYNIGADDIVKEVSRKYEQDDAKLGLVGLGGTNTWIFSALKEGKTEIIFKYCRPWEEEAIESKTYIFTVDKDLNIIIEEK